MEHSETKTSSLDNHRSTSSDLNTSEPQTYEVDSNGSTSLETSPQPPRSKRLWLWLLMALLLVGGGVVVWRIFSPGSEAPSANADQPQETRVKLLEVPSGTIQETSDFVARLESRRSVTLQPQIEGKVTRILVESGDEVTAGTAIIQVDPDEQQAAVSSAAAAAAAARSEIENAKATLKSLEAQRLSNLSDVQYNQKEYERYSQLADQGAVARSLADQYTNTIQTARAELATTNAEIQAQQAAVAQAERQLQQAQANTREQKAQLQYFTISAPFTGTVGDIPVKVGDLVTNSTQLTSITQNRPLQVYVSVPIEQAPQLRLGMPIELLDGQGRSVGTSKVFFISPQATDDTQLVLVKSLFDNSRGQLRADQYARAKVIWNQRQGVLIPATAVTRLGGETFVYVAQTQEQSQQEQTKQQEQSQPEQSQQGQTKLVARQKAVKLGSIQGNNYQVIEGLKPGEQIVVSGLLNLKDGAPITPESAITSQ